MPTAIAYCRVSSSKQDLTMDTQVSACRAWCQANGYALHQVLTDADVSGTVPLLQRPAGRELIETAQAQGATVVVSTYVDRLFRDTLDGLRCLREVFPAHGLKVMLVHEAIDLSTTNGKFFASFRLAQAEFERDITADRTRQNSKRLQNTGRRYGHVPYGCVSIDGALFREPAAWDQRCLVYALAKAHPISQVQELLRKQRILAPQGGRQWSGNTLSNLLKTHERLSQLPLEGDAGAGQGGALDAEVSA